MKLRATFSVNFHFPVATTVEFQFHILTVTVIKKYLMFLIINVMALNQDPQYMHKVACGK